MERDQIGESRHGRHCRREGLSERPDRSELWARALRALFITLCCNLRLQGIENFGISSLDLLFKPFEVGQFCLLAVVAAIVWYDARLPQRYRGGVAVRLLAAAYAFFMVEGRYVYAEDGIDFFSTIALNVVLSALAFVAYYLLIRPIVSILFSLLDKTGDAIQEQWQTRLGGLGRRMTEHPFATSCVVLAVLLVPVTLVSFPGIFMGDTVNQISQGYNLERFRPYMPLIDPAVKLNNHHPVAHTMLMHLCLVVGTTLFHSYNAGMFLLVCIQTVAVILSIANMMRVVVRCCEIPSDVALVATVLLGIHPRMHAYIALVTKDALYTAFLLTALVTLVEITYRGERTRSCAVLAATLVGTILFRNDGVYVIVPTLVAFVAIKGARKVALGGLALVVCFYLAWTGAIMPALSITKGSIREMLSIPFQQTACYLKYHADDVTPQERDAISAVLDYDRLPELYNPDIADPVKSTFKVEATKDDLRAYFLAWASMLRRHPFTYVHATLAGLSDYYYPNAKAFHAFPYKWGEQCMQYTNEFCEEIGTDFHYPQALVGIHTTYEAVREMIFSMPLLGFAILSSTYVWASLFLFAYIARKRIGLAAALAVPFFMQILILSAGPTNGHYFRYAYPLLVCLPLLIAVVVGRNPRAEGSDVRG